jgi:hypothetical protein
MVKRFAPVVFIKPLERITFPLPENVKGLIRVREVPLAISKRTVLPKVVGVIERACAPPLEKTSFDPFPPLLLANVVPLAKVTLPTTLCVTVQFVLFDSEYVPAETVMFPLMLITGECAVLLPHGVRNAPALLTNTLPVIDIGLAYVLSVNRNWFPLECDTVRSPPIVMPLHPTLSEAA